MMKRFSGSGPPAEYSQNGLNEKRRLDDPAINEVGEIVKVAHVVALKLEASSAFTKIAEDEFNVREGVPEDEVFHAFDLLLLPRVTPLGNPLGNRVDGEVH